MNLRFLLLLLGFGFMFTACDDDEPAPSFNAPTIDAPAGISTLVAGAASQAVNFTVTIDSELTGSYAVTGTGVTITTASGDLAAGSNTVTVNFDAGSTPGAASITLTATDSEGQSASGTAVFTVEENPSSIRVVGNITADATWVTGKTYILGGRISVEDGATLTIEAGTVVKGEAGTGVNATALVIARGAKLNAEGTASLPIIFTSIADEITPDQVASGDFASPNLGADVTGLWGGLIVLGRARISASTDAGEQLSEVQIEGIPTSDTNGLYGGSDDADNSGTISYISIRHGGSNIGEGNEINGLTLGGIGSGTSISNVEVVGNQDDGIEWFGGTVSVTNAVVWNAGDDAIDTDQAWAGTLDNFVVVTANGSLFELDGPEGDYTARHTIKNGSVRAIFGGRTTGGSLLDTDNGTSVDFSNIFFAGPLSFTDEDDNTVYLTITDDEFAATTFENVIFNIDAAELGNLMEQGGAVPAGVSAGTTSQADISVLGWTWAAQAGGLEGL
ncbi:MAG: hypothetical protein MK226_22240 [Saprospiraceae bacterium]|nr:hypothetical protein [Saprospiraceae bacterium]